VRIAFDTNVLLDTILNRPGREAALKLMLAVAEEEIEGVVSANSITDLYYLARKGIGDSGAREAVAGILEMFDVAAVDGDVCFMALNTDMSDYEDAVLAVCAANAGADCIATRDEAFIKAEGKPVTAMRPEDVLEAIKGNGE